MDFFFFGEETHTSPGHREKHNHAALHNAATRVGAISIGCICQRCHHGCSDRQPAASCKACRAKELSFANHHANKCCFSLKELTDVRTDELPERGIVKVQFFKEAAVILENHTLEIKGVYPQSAQVPLGTEIHCCTNL